MSSIEKIIHEIYMASRKDTIAPKWQKRNIVNKK